VDLAYRLLGAVLAPRRLIVAGTALGAAVVWLAVVHEAVADPDPVRSLAVIAIPGLLSAAAWWLFQLPPGVVFRPTPQLSDPPPHPTARGYGSAYFECARRAEWRLLARASVGIADDGSLVLVSPPRIRAAPGEACLAFPTRAQPTAAQLREGERTRHPEWVYQPETLVGGPSRLVYQTAADYADAIGKVAVPHARLTDVTPGWQYAGFGRMPAIRVQYFGYDNALGSAYLAFPDRAQRAWVLAQLVGRLSPPLA
jgi:hypothetical protein